MGGGQRYGAGKGNGEAAEGRAMAQRTRQWGASLCSGAVSRVGRGGGGFPALQAPPWCGDSGSASTRRPHGSDPIAQPSSSTQHGAVPTPPTAAMGYRGRGERPPRHTDPQQQGRGRGKPPGRCAVTWMWAPRGRGCSEHRDALPEPPAPLCGLRDPGDGVGPHTCCCPAAVSQGEPESKPLLLEQTAGPGQGCAEYS